MNTHPVHALDPVFQFLDDLIRDHGDALFMVFTYVTVPFLICVLCGGLRRKLLKGKSIPHVPPVIVLHIPIGRPTLPTEPFNPLPPPHESSCHEDDDHSWG